MNKTLNYRALACGIALAASSLFTAPARAAVDIDNFNNNAAVDGYYGSWSTANSPVTGGMLAIGSVGSTATVSGGAYVLNLGLNLSTQSSIQIMATLSSTNQSTLLQVLLTDNNGNQANFSFPTASLSTTAETTLKLGYSTAAYTNSSNATIAQSAFNYASISNLNFQGNYYDLNGAANAPISVNVDDVSAVPEPSVAALVGLGAVGAFYLGRRRTVAQRRQRA